MSWQELGVVSRVGVVATVLAVLTIVIPPISVLSAAVGVVSSGLAVRRAGKAGQRDQAASICLAVSGGLLVLIVVGSAIYAANSP